MFFFFASANGDLVMCVIVWVNIGNWPFPAQRASFCSSTDQLDESA